MTIIKDHYRFLIDSMFNINNRIKYLLILLASLLNIQTAQAAIQIMATRVIYQAPAVAATLIVKNHVATPYLVQIWLEDEQGNTQNLPIIVTPPMFRLDPTKQALLKFIYLGSGLSTTEESLFWINVQEIPPESLNANHVQLAIRSRIKLLYRPELVHMRLSDAVQQLHWFIEDHQLKVMNHSPLHVTLGAVKLNHEGKEIEDFLQDTLAPNKTTTILKNIPDHVKSLSFSYINENGLIKNIPDIAVSTP